MFGGSIPKVSTLAEREAARAASPLEGKRHPMADDNKTFSMLDGRVQPTRQIEAPVISHAPKISAAPVGPKKIERNMKGLVDALFDEIDAMRDGSGSPDRVRALCGVTASIAGLLNTEMKFRRMAKSEDGLADRVKAITG